MAAKTIQVDGSSLTIEQVITVASGDATVTLTPAAVKRMKQSRAWVEQAVEKRAVVYGITTGFGAFHNISVPESKLRELQRNLILSHCAGVGKPLPEEIVRTIMLLRVNALAKGYSGIRVEVVQRLIDMLNKRLHPVVPEQGSVGASGDLAPLSHVAAVLIGEGEAMYKGRKMSGEEAMKAARIPVTILEAKEGLALNNGTQAMTAIGVLALHRASRLADAADVSAGMTVDAVKAKSAPFDARVHTLRPHDGQAASARNIRTMIKKSKLVDVRDGDTLDSVQDSYSIRCIPQVHGASRDAITYVRGVLEREINSATDNPLIFSDDDCSLSAGNFHGQPVALAMDFLGLAVAELGNIAERRVAKLMDRNHNHGLPPFLAGNGGLQSGLMIVQYTAASLVSENKVLIHPSSGDSIPTSANQEDHVSMGTTAARHALRVIDNVEKVIAIELLCASQALEYRVLTPGEGTKKAYMLIRKQVASYTQDRSASNDIALLQRAVSSGLMADCLGKQRP